MGESITKGSVKIPSYLKLEDNIKFYHSQDLPILIFLNILIIFKSKQHISKRSSLYILMEAKTCQTLCDKNLTLNIIKKSKMGMIQLV